MTKASTKQIFTKLFENSPTKKVIKAKPGMVLPGSAPTKKPDCGCGGKKFQTGGQVPTGLPIIAPAASMYPSAKNISTPMNNSIMGTTSKITPQSTTRKKLGQLVAGENFQLENAIRNTAITKEYGDLGKDQTIIKPKVYDNISKVTASTAITNILSKKKTTSIPMFQFGSKIPAINEPLTRELPKLPSRNNSVEKIQPKPVTDKDIYGETYWEGETSDLEKLYNATETKGDFSMVVNLLGHIAEAESFKGKQTYNKDSSASGIFHYLVGNGGDYDKNGKAKVRGGYDKNGGFAGSSFQTAQKRLSSMLNNNKYGQAIKSQPGLLSRATKILSANNPDQLDNQEQAILAFADLKMKGDTMQHYLSGNTTAEELYAQEWVTLSGSHSRNEIGVNWRNAGTRTAKTKESHFDFFSIPMKKVFHKLLTPSAFLNRFADNSNQTPDNTQLRPEIQMLLDGGTLGKSESEALKQVRQRHRLT